MKKHQKPATPIHKKDINIDARSIKTISFMAEHFSGLVKEGKMKEAYKLGIDLVLKLEEDIGFIDRNVMVMYKTLALVAISVQKFAAANAFYLKIIGQLDQFSNDDEFKPSDLYYHTAISFFLLKNYDEAIVYYLKAAYLFEIGSENNNTMLASIYTKIADAYTLKQDRQQAALFLKKANSTQPSRLK
jgi:tetratricopeptide (TPR) repeat protein